MADSNTPVSKNKVSFSERDKRIMYVILSIVIITATYFLGFTKLKEKKSEVEDSNASLQVEVNNLRSMVSRQAEVEADTEDKSSKADKIYKEFPAEVRTQNAIYQLDKAEKKINGLHISSEGFTMDQIFYQGGQFNNGDGTTTAAQDGSTQSSDTDNAGGTDTGITAKNASITISYHVSYKGLKDLIKFVNKNKERMKISEISFSSGDGQKNLECSMTIDMFAVEGNDKEYEEPDVPYIMSGKSNITIK
jgi:regulator of replication initiation timing